MEGWLRVELAATEAWAADGVVPSEAAEACRERASFTVEAVEERERDTGHDVAAFVDVVAASIGPEGRWIHYGLTSSDVLDTALALQLRDAGEMILAGSARLPRRADRARARAPRDDHRRAHPRGPRGADHLRPPACRLRLRGRTQPAPARAGVRGGAGGQALGGRRHLRIGAPGGRAPGDGLARPASRGDLDPGSPPGPPRGGLRRDRAGRGRARALRDRDPKPSADRGARGRGAVRCHPEGLLGDAPQAQPDPHRAALRLGQGPPWLCAGGE